MITTLEAGQNASQVVSTTVLRIFGATNWTGADANSKQQRVVTVNNAGSAAAYLQVVDEGASLTGAVSMSDYLLALASGQAATFKLAPTQTLAVVSASTTTIRASEVLEID